MELGTNQRHSTCMSAIAHLVLLPFDPTWNQIPLRFTFHVNLELKPVHSEDLQVLHDNHLTNSGQLQRQWSRGAYMARVTVKPPTHSLVSSTHCRSFWCCSTVSLCRRSKLYFSSEACCVYTRTARSHLKTN